MDRLQKAIDHIRYVLNGKHDLTKEQADHLAVALIELELLQNNMAIQNRANQIMGR